MIATIDDTAGLLGESIEISTHMKRNKGTTYTIGTLVLRLPR